MGMFAEVIAVGPFSRDILDHLEYGEIDYKYTQEGAIINLTLFGTGEGTDMAACRESTYLEPRFRNISQLTAILILIFTSLLVYLVGLMSAYLLGIDSEIALETQDNYKVWIAILFLSIPLSAIPGYFIISPIFAALMNKWGWLNKEESVILRNMKGFLEGALKPYNHTLQNIHAKRLHEVLD